MICHRLTWILVLLLTTVPAAARVERAAATEPSADVNLLVKKIEPGPTLVSGKLKRVGALEMFSKLAETAKVALVPSEDAVFDDPALQNAVFSTEWDKQPFWDALREACESANVHPGADEHDEGTAQLRLYRGPSHAPTAVDGIGVVRVSEIVRDATIAFGEHAHQPDRLRVTFRVLLEPKTHGWAWIGVPVINKAEDEKGHALTWLRPHGDDARGTRYAGGAGAVSAVFEFPAGAGQRIAHLEGTIPIEVADRAAVVTFHDPLGHAQEDRSAPVGDNRLVLKHVAVEANAIRPDLFVRRGANETNERWRVVGEPFGHFSVLRATLVTPKGDIKSNAGSASFDDAEGHAEMYFQLHEANEKPTDLRVQLPAGFTPVTLKFEFKDLPMP